MYRYTNVVLRFFDSRYKVSVMWDLNPRPVSMLWERSSTVDFDTRSDIESKHINLWLVVSSRASSSPILR